MRVAALYVDPLGPYPGLLGKDQCWDEKRDARNYWGPYPVVAHPPCGPWGRLRHMCTKQDADHAPRAAALVRELGGVLEHPAGSLLWKSKTRPMPYPDEFPDAWGGFTVEVDQVEWGHVARKRTWLYVVGVPRERVQALIDARPFPGREPTHHIACDTRRRRRNSYRTKSASEQMRRRTPTAFAEFLIAIAEQAGKALEKTA